MTAPVIADALGPRGRRRAAIASVVALVVLGAIVWIGLDRLADKGQLDGERWEPLTEWLVWKYLLLGLVETLKAAGLSMVLALAFGAVLAIGRLSRRRPVSWLATGWTELFRGFPLLVLMLFAVFGLRSQGVDISTFRGVVLALTLYNSAVFAEIFRAGIRSLERGQTEAALAVGLTDGQAMRSVVLPQALRRMLPAIVNQLVTLLKDTSLGFLVQYDELLRRGQLSGQYDGNMLQSLVAVAGLYIAVNFVLSQVARRLETRQRRRLHARPITVTGIEGTVEVA
ncbi:MAG TPA: amino acid ABC transporter permease [Acidimicrobiales bacterium]|nr:amino acid ABC transporter permease [Acidimicrobiales bacterium]